MAAACTVDTLTSDVQKPMGLVDAPYHPRCVINRAPTPQDLLELSARIYKSSRRLYHEADSQGMRVYHDELIMGDVRLVMLVPSWFPKAHVAFDWDRVQGDTVSVVLVIRGTCQDLIGNTKANLQLLFNKLVDDEHLPDVATDATKVIQAWLLELLLRQPQLDANEASSSSSGHGGNRFIHGPDVFGRLPQRKQPGQKQLHLDVHVTGHSLGGLLAEVATVESLNFAAAHGATWHCTSFESPGLPDLYHRAALRSKPKEHWDEAVVSYLAAPNAINMLYEHLGRVVHVVVPWEQTWSHVAKCVGADVARVTAWAIVGGMVLAGMKQLTSSSSAAAAGTAAARAVQKQQEEEAAVQNPVGLGRGLPGLPRLLNQCALQQEGGIRMQECDAVMPHVIAGAGALGAGIASGVNAPAGIAGGAVSHGAAATVGGTTLVGPPVPPVFTVSETLSGGGRTLASVGSSIAGASMAAAANAAAAAATGPTSAAAPALVSGAAAAAGEAIASVGSARIMQYVAQKSGLGVLANTVGRWLLGRGGFMGVLECLAGVLGVETEELIAQHALGPMRQCFDPHTGQLKPRYKREMASWPHLGHRRRVLLTAAKQVAKWSVPSFLCRDNMGVANIMSRTAMVEARCARLKGYVVKEGQEDAAVYDTAHLYSAGMDNAAAPAAADGNPLLARLLSAEQGLLRHLSAEEAEIHACMQQRQEAAARTVDSSMGYDPLSMPSSPAGAAALPELPARDRMHRRMLRPTSAVRQRQQSAGSGTAAATAVQQQHDMEGDGVQALIAAAAAMDLDGVVTMGEGLRDARTEGLRVEMMDFEEMGHGQGHGSMQVAFGGF